MSRFIAVAREPVYSPGKVEDDRAILEAVAARLRERRHEVQIVEADEPWPLREDSVIAAMCQGPEALLRLDEAERRGIPVINSPAAIRGCHRVRLVRALSAGGVPQPESIVLPTAGEPAPPPWLEQGAWLKRGDVHAVRPQDVMFVRSQGELRQGLAGLRCVGVENAVLQRHVPGPVVKFYAVGGDWIACFADGGDGGKVRPPDELISVARRSARILGLDIYGGDAVVTDEGIVLVDLNDWPSYRRCRAAAAEMIAAYLERQVSARNGPANATGRGRSL